MNLEFLLAFLVLFHLVPRFSTEEFKTPSLATTCPKDFQCGNLGNMSFPFTNSSPTYCGLCSVDCFNDHIPKIKLDPMSDQWFSCNSRSQSKLKLHYPELQQLLIHPSCDVFFRNISLPRSASISYAIMSNITLFRCDKNPEPSKEVVDYFRGYSKNESCPEFNIYYRYPKSENSSEEFPPPGCTTVLLPVHPRDNVLDNTDLFRVLTADFDLEWHLSDECYDCHLKGGLCWAIEQSKFDCYYDDTGAGNKKRKIILSTAATACGVAFFVILVFCVRRKLPFCNSLDFWKIKTEDHNVEAFLKNYGSLAPKRYHYSDVKKMTNSFSIKLGRGGYGSVYKGKLKDGSLVAVKVLKESKGNGEEFINEVASISRTSHVNIVTLFGFCFQGGKKALIYEFMPNGSLEKFIYGEKSLMNRQLEWKTLYKIAVGIARGLEYLHRGCNTRILHFDIKPHNILLDEDFCPKISDFGLAKLCPGKESIISTLTARGTIGYIAPEVVCKSVGEVSHKSDVYSYGMMVLEMVGGRKNVDVGVDRSSEIYFPNWIYTRLDRGEELGLSGIMDEEENEKARKMLIVSLWCIQVHPSYRPTITNVLETLEGPLEALQMPPKPFFYSPPRASSEGSTTAMA